MHLCDLNVGLSPFPDSVFVHLTENQLACVFMCMCLCIVCVYLPICVCLNLRTYMAFLFGIKLLSTTAVGYKDYMAK